MSVLEFILFLIVAAVCGSIAQALAGFSRGGCLVSMAVGFIGAMLGGKLSQVLGLPEIFVLNFGNNQLPIVWSIIGGTLFVAIVGLVTRGMGRPR